MPIVRSYNSPNKDVEYLRNKAEIEHGDNWSPDAFYNHENFLYTVGYVDNIPHWVCLLQQHKLWRPMNIIGLCRRGYTDLPIRTGIDSTSLGYFGEESVIQGYNRAMALGFNKIVVSSERKSFVRSSIGRLARMQQLTGEQWFTSYNRYNTLPNTDCFQYCMWNNNQECFFEKET